MEKNSPQNGIFPSGLSFNVNSYDVEEMRKQALFWSLEHRQLSRGQFSGNTRAFHMRDMQISLAHRSVGVFVRGEIPPRTTIISFPLSPKELYFRGQLMREGQALVLNHADELDIHTLYPSTFLTVVVSTAQLEDQAFSLLGRSFIAAYSKKRLQFKPEAYKQCTGFLRLVLKDINYRNNLLDKFSDEVMVREILEMILLGADSPAIEAEKKLPRLSLTQEAADLIRNNLKDELSINDLCRNLGISARTLYLGFNEFMGVSPKAFRQILRLNEVHKELLLNRRQRTVTDIAMEWSFFHLGRFSEQYRRMFGELPSET
jgi:AraC family ethanolamine operon transcriptional activator